MKKKVETIISNMKRFYKSLKPFKSVIIYNFCILVDKPTKNEKINGRIESKEKETIKIREKEPNQIIHMLFNRYDTNYDASI